MASSLELAGPLLVRPYPLVGEGLRGYFLRLAEDNELLPELDLYRMLFGSTTHAAATRSRLAQAAEATGVPFAALMGLGSRGLAQTTARTCRFAGQGIALSRLRSARCAICPKCLGLKRALYASWELSAVAACPRHACWLIDQCPRCNGTLSWRRPGVSRCRCGFDLSAAAVSPAPAAVCALTAIVEERIGAELATKAGSQFGFPQELDTIPFNQLLGIFYLLTNAKLREAGTFVPDMTSASEALRSDAATACTAADAMLQWPAGWHALQKRVNAAHFSLGPLQDCDIVTYREALAPLVAIVRTPWSAAADFPSFLRPELHNFVKERVIEVGRHRLYATGTPPATASLRQRTLKHLRPWGGRGDVARSRFSGTAVRELLDATEHQIELLMSAGAVTPVQREWRTGEELDHTFHVLAGNAQSRSSVKSPRDLVPLSEISQWSGEALARHVHNIRRGKTPCFTWAHCTPPGLANLCIPASAVAACGP